MTKVYIIVKSCRLVYYVFSMARKMSIYQQESNRRLERQAITLYQRGKSTRQIATILPRSREWVRMVIKKHLPNAVK